MLQLFFAVAFSAVPLTLYVPPMRHLTLFVASMEELFRETSGYRNRVFPRLRRVFRFLLTATTTTTTTTSR